MNYEEFLSYVQKKVQETLGGHTRVELHRVLKNNAVAKEGLLILEEGRSIAPAIYMGSYYSAYLCGMSMPEVISDVVAAYRKSRIDVDPEPSFYRNFSDVAPRVACKLINYERNRELLQKVPHFRYLDLAAVCYYLIEHEAFGKGTLQIYHSHLEMWEVSEEELLEQARENTLPLLHWKVQSMEELFAEMGKGKAFESLTSPFPMYILSNAEKTLGASVILYDQVLSAVGEKLGEDYYILPSSIHECIAVPASIPYPRDFLEEMVRDINQENVPKEEVLSNQVYLYEREKHQLSM